MKSYLVQIVNNNYVIDEIEVEAETKEEAEQLGVEEWLQGLKERCYGEVIEEDNK